MPNKSTLEEKWKVNKGSLDTERHASALDSHHKAIHSLIRRPKTEFNYSSQEVGLLASISPLFNKDTKVALKKGPPDSGCCHSSILQSLPLSPTTITRSMVGGLRSCQRCHSSDRTLVIGHVNVFSHVSGQRCNISPMYYSLLWKLFLPPLLNMILTNFIYLTLNMHTKICLWRTIIWLVCHWCHLNSTLKLWETPSQVDITYINVCLQDEDGGQYWHRPLGGQR